MRIHAALATALLWAASSFAAFAQDFGRPVALVALQPLPESVPADIDAVLKAQWPAYYRSAGEHGFGPDQVRAGRIDLNEDGRAELVLLVEAPDWNSVGGGPLLVARWTERGWTPIGWSYAEPEGVFVTSDRAGGWATIATPTYWLRWSGKSYSAVPRGED
jgi:hypothetical protein